MKIAVMADTHDLAIPEELLNVCRQVDMIIHAGDFSSVDMYESLRKLNVLKAVCGNSEDGRLLKKLPRKIVFTAGDTTIGLFHGEGSRQTTLDGVRKEFFKDKVDIVIFGHTHSALKKSFEGVLYFNPGSPNDTVTARFCSYGIIEINEKCIKANIIKVKN